MRKRQLGKTKQEVPAIVLGGNVFGWTVDEASSFRLLDRALEGGLNFIDTANVYSRWIPGNQGGESETIIGRWVAQRRNRERVFLATKVGMDMGGGNKGLSAKNIQQGVEGSLRRLQTDYIDLYFSHVDDQETPLEETLQAYARLIEQGKVRFIGASNYSGERLREAFSISMATGLPRYEVLQPHYNLLEREDYEAGLAPVVQEFGIGVVPYFALASGFLTGKYRSAEDLKNRARGSRVEKYLNERGLSVLAALDAVAQEVGAAPGQVALAWLLAQPGITAPIASATNEQQVDELVKAANVELSAHAIERLNQASAPPLKRSAS